MQLVRASIDVRASVAEALRRWSEFLSFAPSLPDGASSGSVAFHPVNGAESRVTVHLAVDRVTREPATGLVEFLRRELEQDLRAFKHFLEGSERPRHPRESC